MCRGKRRLRLRQLLLQAFVLIAQDQNLHTVSPFRAEHKGRPTEWIKPEHLLHQRRKSIMTFTKVHRDCRHVHLQIGTRRNHRDVRIARIKPARCSTSTSVRITTLP
jgi:hypothetical protein